MKSKSTAGQAIARARPLKALLIEARAAVFDPTLCQDLNLTARRVLFGALTFLNLKNVRTAIFLGATCFARNRYSIPNRRSIED